MTVVEKEIRSDDPGPNAELLECGLLEALRIARRAGLHLHLHESSCYWFLCDCDNEEEAQRK